MPLEIIRNDITLVNADAIVNAANETLLGGGGVDGAIHRAAGPELLEECRTLSGCRTGEAKITGGYRLPAKYVIHTVGPIWRGGGYGEREKLISCYRNSLRLAREYGCESVAFPLISAGVYGYPKEAAFRIAVDTIREFLSENEMLAYIVVFDRGSLRLADGLFGGVQRYIDDHYVDVHVDSTFENARSRRIRENWLYPESEAPGFEAASAKPVGTPVPSSLEDALQTLDESFSQMLLRKIDEAGIKDAQCYKRANIDRKLFSKIRSNPLYRPSKRTALALAVALELPLEETRELLCRAGYALSHSSKFDVIVEYFIVNRKYDVQEINEALFFYEQQLLGG